MSPTSDDVGFHLLGDLLREAGVAPVAPAASDAPGTPPLAEAGAGETPVAIPRSRVPHLARRVAQVWHAAVGDEIAANALPRQLRNGRLVVAASSPAWAQSLQFMAEDIRGKLNHLLGEEAVMTVFFRHAGWEAPPGPSAGVAAPAASPAGEPTAGDGRAARSPVGARALDDGPPLDAEQLAALESLDSLGLSPELAGSIARAMRAAFMRCAVRDEK